MSSTQSPHGFEVVRGRGYRPGQVDQRVAALFQEAATAKERLGRLDVLARELGEEAERLHATVSALPPPTYESLGGRAVALLAEVEAEAADVRRRAGAEAATLRADAEAHAHELRATARARAAGIRAAGEKAGDAALARAGVTADEARAAARVMAERLRGEAEDHLREITERCAELLSGQERDQAACGEAAEAERAARKAQTAAHAATLEERGRAALEAARRAYAEAEEAADAAAEATAAETAVLLAKARAQAEDIDRETGRVLREHNRRADELRDHLARVRSTLSTLTGQVPSSPTGV
ncbi:cellulose-binding protein [Streptomyces sp. JJ66]|uniref:cellulose-binding protein n=1 Tax=Streptomyces sp. JJ66 TaxID=2803843 RepID=UPI001C5A4310|nr:cellulose-binding protein [Streptomyces sp. JJ66]MBW1602732.1 cellulose-binding protein [Streptomyces sp. JJ66]